MINENNSKDYLLNLINRERLTLDGVKNVEAFGEDYLTLSTQQGEIIIEGSNLKIEELKKENGQIEIVGLISAISFKDTKEERSIFKKIFK